MPHAHKLPGGWAWLSWDSARGGDTIDEMGDLVEGIGDEVLLFGAFLAFTACIVIVVNFWQGRTGRDRQAQAPRGIIKGG